MRPHLPAILAASILLGSSPVHADEYSDAVEAGHRFNRAKEYPQARAEYEKAFALRADATLVYLIAETHRLEGHDDEALVHYERYLTASTTSAVYRRNAEDFVTAIKARRPKPERPADPLPQPPRTEVIRHRRIPTSSKIAAGVTGAALVSTTVFTVIGLRAERDLKTNLAATQEDADRVGRLESYINISLGVTLAAAATTVVLYYATPSYRSERRTVAVAPIGDGWGAFVGGRF